MVGPGPPPSFPSCPTHTLVQEASGPGVRWVLNLAPPHPRYQDQTPLTLRGGHCGGRVRSVGRALCRAASSLCPQLVYMGFDAVAAKAALRVFRGNVQLAAQTLVLNGGKLPPDLQLSAEDSSSTPSTSPSDSAGKPGVSEHRVGGSGWRRCLIRA